MRKDSVKQQINAELTGYFEHARRHKCPPSMKKHLYQRIGLSQQSMWLKPAMAFSFVALTVSGFVWHNHSQHQKLLQAEHDLQVAMHYMQKVSNKTLSGVSTHGIKPAIIVPLTKSMAKI